jgi:hypothetical protein
VDATHLRKTREKILKTRKEKSTRNRAEREKMEEKRGGGGSPILRPKRLRSECQAHFNGAGCAVQPAFESLRSQLKGQLESLLLDASESILLASQAALLSRIENVFQ